MLKDASTMEKSELAGLVPSNMLIIVGAGLTARNRAKDAIDGTRIDCDRPLAGLADGVAYRGLPVIVFARSSRCWRWGFRPAAAAELHRDVHGARGRLHPSFFPLFLLGAVFGKLMETSGRPVRSPG